MNYKEFWAAYHRDDPNEALDHPHRLMIYLRNGEKHKAFFPGSLLATSWNLSIGIGFKRDGTHRDSIFVPWEEIERIEPLKEIEKAHRRKHASVK